MFLMFLIMVLGGIVVKIPMPVLVGIMVMVSIGTFDWSSFSYLRKAPITDSLVMVTTVGIVVYTGDLSKGVIAGVILSAIFFVAKISKLEVQKRKTDAGDYYSVTGQLFFASVEEFVDSFDYGVTNTSILIDFSNSHIWDDSGVGAVDKVVMKLQENGNEVKLKGLNGPSKKIVNRLAVYHKANAPVKTN